MLTKSIVVTVLCLLVVGCSGTSMGGYGASSSSGTSGSSSPTSYESGYGIRSGSGGMDGGHMDWGR